MFREITVLLVGQTFNQEYFIHLQKHSTAMQFPNLCFRVYNWENPFRELNEPSISFRTKKMGDSIVPLLPFFFLLFICSTSCVIKFLMLFNLSLKLKKLTMWCKLLNMCRQFKVENLGGSNLNLKYQDGIQRSMWNIHYLELHIEDPEFHINQSIFYFRK